MKEYKFKTTFWQDFTRAEKKSIDEVKKKHKELFKGEYKYNYIFLTELALVLSLKHKEHLTSNVRLSKLYNKLFEQTNEYAVQNLKFGELDYYFDNVD